MSEETRNVANKQGGALATLDLVSDSGMGLENIGAGTALLVLGSISNWSSI